MFKKTAIAALVLGFSGAASAAMYAPAPAPACSAGNVTVPCEGTAWDLGIDYLHIKNRENVLSTFFLNGNTHDADYGSGFRLEGSYHWGTGNDFNVNWSHVSKTSQSTGVIAAGVTDELDSKLDVVNLEVGQHIDVGENWNIRVHGGVQYARLRNDLDVDITDAVPVEEMRVKGWGPRAGVDAQYDFGNGFGLFANGAVAILNAEQDTTLLVQLNNGITIDQNLTVTSTDARIGAMYTHAMAQGDLTIRGGYQVNNFINADFGASDLSWDGWFVGLKWVGNA